MFKYSICHPDKEEIEYKNKPISEIEVLDIAENYPWEEKLKLTESLINGILYFNPSLDFTCIENGRSFCLTANYGKNMQLEFSLWYNRPKKKKSFMGIFGEKEKMFVDDIWGFSLNQSLKYLKYFIQGNYSLVEELYQK